MAPVGFDGAGKNGCRPFGADSHHNGVAVDDGGGDELAVGEVIDDIDQRALGGGDGGGAGVFGGVFVCCVKQCGTVDIAVVQRTVDQGQFAHSCQPVDISVGGFGENRNPRFGFQQEPQFGQCRLAAARDNDAFAGHGEKDRKMLHCGYPVKTYVQYRILFWLLDSVRGS